jgi:hypothetical protein
MKTSTLELLFAGDAAHPADTGPMRVRVMSADDIRDSDEGCAEVASRLAAGERLLITIGLMPDGRLRRAATLLLLPLRLALIERNLTRAGCSVTRYAVGPSLALPSVVYEVNSAAAAYANTHLLNHGRRLMRVRAAMRWWLSCDPSMGGIVLVARR